MPKKAKLAVLATGDLAVPVLEAVVEAGHEIVCLISHRPKQDDAEDPFLPEEHLGEALGNWAAGRGIQMQRRSRPGSDAVLKELEKTAPELGLVVAYGRGFPEALLEVPSRGWLKVHFSLLPKHRGLHPIRSTLWRGDRQAGASVIQVSEEPDAGPILEQESFDIEPEETFGELAPRVGEAAARIAPVAVARALRSKDPKARKQNEKSASTTPRFGSRHTKAPWWREAGDVANRLRALSPEPGMTTFIKGEKVRILKGSVAEYIDSPIAEAGSFIGLRAGRIAVLCGDGKAFTIDRVLRRDGSTATASSFALEKRLQVGDDVI